MPIKDAQFSHEELMKKLGLNGEFDAIRNVICSLKSDEPYIEVIYFDSSEQTIIKEE